MSVYTENLYRGSLRDYANAARPRDRVLYASASSAAAKRKRSDRLREECEDWTVREVILQDLSRVVRWRVEAVVGGQCSEGFN